MSISQAMWTHGHSVRIENPDSLLSVTRSGTSVSLVGNAKSVWIHYAIPSPVIVNDKRLKTDAVMIRCRTYYAWITAVHIYDGEQKIASHSGLRQESKNWSFLRYEVPDRPNVRWGIGVSIKIEFSNMPFLDYDLSNPINRLPNVGGAYILPNIIEGGAPIKITPQKKKQPNYTFYISSVGCDFSK